MRMRKLSEGGLKVLVQGLCRARIQKFVSESPCYRVRLERTEDRMLGAVAGRRGAAAFGAPEHRQAVGAGQDDPARAVDGRAERRRSGADGRSGRVEPDAEGARGAGAAGAGRADAAPDPRQPDAGERDRHPGGAVADPEPRARGDVEDPARLLPARAAAADQERAGRRRRPRRGDGGAAREDRRAPGCPTRRASRPKSRCGASTRCTPRAPRRACCAPTSSG